MFILRTDNLFMLSFSAISSFKGKLCLFDIGTTDSGRNRHLHNFKRATNTALISEGKFCNFQV